MRRRPLAMSAEGGQLPSAALGGTLGLVWHHRAGLLGRGGAPGLAHGERVRHAQHERRVDEVRGTLHAARRAHGGAKKLPALAHPGSVAAAAAQRVTALRFLDSRKWPGIGLLVLVSVSARRPRG